MSPVVQRRLRVRTHLANKNNGEVNEEVDGLNSNSASFFYKVRNNGTEIQVAM